MESQFEKNDRDIGRVKVGVTTTITFNMLPEATKKIIGFQVGCSKCMKGLQLGQTGIEITFKAEAIPVHLKMEGIKKYNINKSARVFYEDNTSETLRILGIVYE